MKNACWKKWTAYCHTITPAKGYLFEYDKVQNVNIDAFISEFLPTLVPERHSPRLIGTHGL